MSLLQRVGWTVLDFLDGLSEFEPVTEHRPIRFRRQELQLGAKRCRIESEGWRMGGDRLCGRYARIQGSAMDIATVMVYPTASPDVFPVFAAEWVVFGERVHALILDVEVCGDQPELMEDLQRAFAGLGAYWRKQFPENRDRPEWFESIATPWVLYGTCSSHQIDQLRLAFNDYLEMTIAEFYRPKLLRGLAGPDHPSVRGYKVHHYENSPGHRLLGVKMGQKLADELLKDWHFGPTRIDTEPAPVEHDVLPYMRGTYL